MMQIFFSQKKSILRACAVLAILMLSACGTKEPLHFMYVVQIYFFLIVMGPIYLAILFLIITPNNRTGLAISLGLTTTAFVLFFLPKMNIDHPKDFFTIKSAAFIGIGYAPSLLLKLLAIRKKQLGHITLSRSLPFLGILGPIILFQLGPVLADISKPEPPTISCVNANITAKMGGYNIHLAPLALFDIDNHAQRSRTDYADICDTTNNGTKPTSVQKIDMAFGKAILDRTPYNSVCTNPALQWQKKMCMKYNSSIDYPRHLRIYEIGSGNGSSVPGMTFIYRDTMNQYFGTQSATLTKDENGNKMFRGKNQEVFWILEDRIAPDGAPYTIKCSDSGGEKLHCDTAYAINDKLAVRYAFIADRGHVPRMARAVGDNVQAILTDLQIKKSDAKEQSFFGRLFNAIPD